MGSGDRARRPLCLGLDKKRINGQRRRRPRAPVPTFALLAEPGPLHSDPRRAAEPDVEDAARIVPAGPDEGPPTQQRLGSHFEEEEEVAASPRRRCSAADGAPHRAQYGRGSHAAASSAALSLQRLQPSFIERFGVAAPHWPRDWARVERQMGLTKSCYFYPRRQRQQAAQRTERPNHARRIADGWRVVRTQRHATSAARAAENERSNEQVPPRGHGRSLASAKHRPSAIAAWAGMAWPAQRRAAERASAARDPSTTALAPSRSLVWGRGAESEDELWTPLGVAPAQKSEPGSAPTPAACVLRHGCLALARVSAAVFSSGDVHIRGFPLGAKRAAGAANTARRRHDTAAAPPRHGRTVACGQVNSSSSLIGLSSLAGVFSLTLGVSPLTLGVSPGSPLASDAGGGGLKSPSPLKGSSTASAATAHAREWRGGT
ncbi:unnamed protein product [Lampetra planeri]